MDKPKTQIQEVTVKRTKKEVVVEGNGFLFKVTDFGFSSDKGELSFHFCFNQKKVAWINVNITD